MTGMLKDLMTERADSLESPAPDLDGIVRNGDRRVRRRRVGAAVAGVAAVAALGVTVPMIGGPTGDDETHVAASEADRMTWSTGSEIHSDGETVDVGHEVRAFVQTDAGYVFADEDGAVWSWTGSEAEEVGSVSADHPRLVRDRSHVGWVESPRAGKPVFVFLDQSSGETVRNDDFTRPGMGTLADEADSAYLYAVDGDSAIWHDSRGVVSFDIETGESTVLRKDDGNVTSIHDVENGRFLHTAVTGDGNAEGVVVSSGLTDEGRRLPVWDGDLSPSATFLLSENSDDFKVLEVADGRDLTPAAKSDYDFFTGTHWIDDTTYMAIGLKGDETSPVDLLTCEVATRDCTVTGDDLVTYGDFQLPVGERLGD